METGGGLWNCLQFFGVKSHSSLGSGELYHRTLRRVFSVFHRTHPDIHPDVALRMSLKGMNDTMGPDGLVPTPLVIGTLPTVPAKTSDLPTQRARAAALRTSRE